MPSSTKKRALLSSKIQPPTIPNNRHLRTRKDLLEAASRLIKREQGRKPSMEEVAAEALVSRATAYRYFPNVEALLAEAPADAAVTAALENLFTHSTSTDPEARIDAAEAAMHQATYASEAQLRLMLAHTLTRTVPSSPLPPLSPSPLPPFSKSGSPSPIPLRQNRRISLIESALAPARDQFKPAAYERLCAALCLIFGTESMIVFRDVLPLEPEKARRVKSWAVKALIRAALEP